MRLRHLVIATCCVVVQLAAPAPAQAWWEWLDQLSGPGPFTGLDIQWRVKCIPDNRAASIAENLSLENIEPGKGRNWARFLGAGCLFEKANVNPLGSLNLSIGWMRSIENDLQYAGGDKPVVHLTRFEPSLSVFVDSRKFVEITSGYGLMLVRGKRFDGFHRFYWRPVAVTITPGAKAASIRLGLLLATKGFDATDFGATPGTFHTDKEVLGTAEVTVDLTRLGKHLRRAG